MIYLEEVHRLGSLPSTSGFNVSPCMSYGFYGCQGMFVVVCYHFAVFVIIVVDSRPVMIYTFCVTNGDSFNLGCGVHVPKCCARLGDRWDLDRQSWIEVCTSKSTIDKNTWSWWPIIGQSMIDMVNNDGTNIIDKRFQPSCWPKTDYCDAIHLESRHSIAGVCDQPWLDFCQLISSFDFAFFSRTTIVTHWLVSQAACVKVGWIVGSWPLCLVSSAPMAGPRPLSQQLRAIRANGTPS